jgi:hypothetical protein
LYIIYTTGGLKSQYPLEELLLIFLFNCA